MMLFYMSTCVLMTTFKCFAHWTVQSVKEDGGDFNSTEILVSEPKKVGDGMSAYVVYKVTTRVRMQSFIYEQLFSLS